MTMLARAICTLSLLTISIMLPARAAESYDGCAGFIDNLPATISTQGVWCLRKDLGTNITSGNAIVVVANNVIIDCNEFKIGGLAAGGGSGAKGIFASDRQNIAIRHCSIRGFNRGIYLTGGAGHLVEDNRLDNNLYMGIYVAAVDNSVVRRNRVYDTGGLSNGTEACGICAKADILDNTVSGVFTDGTTSALIGIAAYDPGSRVEGNRVAGEAPTGGTTYGILSAGGSSPVHQTLAGNRVDGSNTSTALTGVGIKGFGTSATSCAGNTVFGFATAMSNCADDGGNGLH